MRFDLIEYLGFVGVVCSEERMVIVYSVWTVWLFSVQERF